MQETVADYQSRVQAETEQAPASRYFVRLNRAERVQHMILVACFVILVLTGFMIKIPEEMVKSLGTTGEMVFQYRSLLHRTAGTVLILVSIYHVYYLIFKAAGRRWLMDMLPRPKDLKDMRDTLFYYIGIKNQPPEFDRFSYKQKMEYGALIVGNTLMAATGLLMWTESMWPKFIVDIASVVHGMEAILACLALILWHLYEIHLGPHKNPFNNMWVTGLMSEDELKAEHPLHYKKIMANSELQKVYLQQKRPHER